jgi:hypothetical protein
MEAAGGRETPYEQRGGLDVHGERRQRRASDSDSEIGESPFLILNDVVKPQRS